MWDRVKQFVRNQRRHIRGGKISEMNGLKSGLEKVDQIICPQLDPNSDICGSGVTNSKLLGLLVNCPKFEKMRGESKVKEINYDNCGKGNGYLSLVIKVYVCFEDENKPQFSLVLKVPMPDAIKKMISNGEHVEEKVGEFDENTRTIVEGHNRECEFYERFGEALKDYPMPETYYTQQFIEGSDQIGLILMENLGEKCEILGIARAVTPQQIYGMSRLLAQLQFRVQQMEEHRSWWMSLENNLHLDAFYNSWMPTGLPSASKFEEIAPMMKKLKTICNADFGRFALRQRPEEYNAITFCHGDIQMYNILYPKQPNGGISDDLVAMIDFQIVLYGNPCFDLARFLVFCSDEAGHRDADVKAYGVYYGELTRLYASNGKDIPFTFEQGFELFELAFCHQTTYLTSFLFFFGEMAKQSETVAQNLNQMAKRAQYCISQTLKIIDKYKLDRFSR